MPTSHLQRGTIGVNPEDDGVITDAPYNVGFGNSSNSPINDMFAQVVKHIVDSFFDFKLENGQLVFHVTERSKLSDGGDETRRLQPERDGRVRSDWRRGALLAACGAC